MSIAKDRLSQHRQQALVEPLHRFVDRLQRRADEMRRDAFPPPFELPLMEEAQAGREKRDDGGGLVHSRCERRRGRGSSWFSRKRASLFW